MKYQHKIDSSELPRYQCHKQVGALKIAAIEFKEDGSAIVAPESVSFLPFTVDNYRQKFHGDENDLGYYVRYSDEYESWSPTKAFEEGYFRL